MRDRIQKLLGNGLSPTLVASAVGCEPSYISQLMAEPEFALAVASVRCQDLESLKERDSRYDSLEDRLLERLENVLPLMLRPREILSALQVINSAKRRADDLIKGAPQSTTFQNVVVLQLPQQILQAFQTNQQNEVISIDQRSLVAMPAPALMKELANDPTPTPQDRTTVAPSAEVERPRRNELSEKSV